MLLEDKGARLKRHTEVEWCVPLSQGQLLPQKRPPPLYQHRAKAVYYSVYQPLVLFGIIKKLPRQSCLRL